MTQFLLVLVLSAAPAAEQEAQPQVPAMLPSLGAERQPAGSNGPEADELPISLDRIQRKLARPPALRLKGERIVFRVEVLGRRPSIEDILGPDYLKGPVPYGSMTHQEFLNMVTPTGVRGYSPYNNREAFMVAATSFALKWALQQAIHKFETAKHEREREAARKEVEDALAELDRARARAGLPPK